MSLLGWMVALLTLLFVLWVRVLYLTTNGFRDLGRRDVLGDMALLAVGGAMLVVAAMVKSLR